MIKFSILEKGNSTDLINELSLSGNKDDIEDIVSSFLPFAEDFVEVGFCRVGECLLVRLFENGEYTFVYPIALEDGADERGALEELRLYAVSEEIPLCFCDVPPTSVETLEDAFRYTDAFCDDEGESYYVRVATELSRLPDIPTMTDGVIVLSEITERDIPSMAMLSRDTELNKFWGYDYREDNPDPEDEYFYNMASRAQNDGTALTLAVKCGDEFVGEGCIFGFNLLGEAEIGFRILKDKQGKGFGERALRLLISLGDEMGLLCLRASAMKQNTPSIKLLDRNMELVFENEKVNKYLHKYR